MKIKHYGKMITFPIGNKKTIAITDAYICLELEFSCDKTYLTWAEFVALLEREYPYHRRSVEIDVNIDNLSKIEVQP